MGARSKVYVNSSAGGWVSGGLHVIVCRGSLFLFIYSIFILFVIVVYVCRLEVG